MDGYRFYGFWQWQKQQLGFPASANGDSLAGVGNAALPIKPVENRPPFFTAAEYAMVERLAEIIIPSDRTPGAKGAGVAEFIDFMVASDPDEQLGFRSGLAWLHAHREQTVVELTPAQTEFSA